MQSANSQRKYTVLVVEDHFETTHFLQKCMSQEGREVIIVATVDAACLLLEGGGIDLLLLDWHLNASHIHQDRVHSTTGRRVLETARKLYRLMPIIVMSGYTFVDVGNEALGAGADCFLPKPLNMPALLNLIQRWSERRQEAVQFIKLETENDIIPIDKLKEMYVKKAVEITGTISQAAKRLEASRQTVSEICRDSHNSKTHPPQTP